MQYLDLNGGCINKDGAERVAVRCGCALGFRVFVSSWHAVPAVARWMLSCAEGWMSVPCSVDVFLRGGMDGSGRDPSEPRAAQPRAEPPGAAGLTPREECFVCLLSSHV